MVRPAVDRREPLTNDEIARYSRHLIIPDVGVEGQERMKAARVLLVGTGGLGSPLALYLATQPAPGPTGQTFSLLRR